MPKEGLCSLKEAISLDNFTIRELSMNLWQSHQIPLSEKFISIERTPEGMKPDAQENWQ